MKHGSLFSGGGGFDFASELIGWENLFHCENNEFCQTILKYYWPKSKSYGDIKTTEFTIWRGRVDILTGGFPCQPFSLAGNRKGTNDDRYLWPEMLKAIREIKPKYIVGENVYGLVNWSDGLVFKQVQVDLANEGYETIPIILPAASIGANHLRNRIWFVAHSISDGHQRNNGSGKNRSKESQAESKRDKWKRFWDDAWGNVSEEFIANAYGQRLSEWFQERFRSVPNSSGTFQGREFTRTFTEEYWREFPTQSPICSRNDGLPPRLVPFTVSKKGRERTLTENQTFGRWRKEALKVMGNAIVPQVALQIFKTIEDYENITTLNPIYSPL